MLAEWIEDAHSVVHFEVHLNLGVRGREHLLHVLNDLLGHERVCIHLLLLVLDELRQLAQEHDVVEVTCLQAVCDDVDVQRVLLLDGRCHRLGVSILNVCVAKAIDKVVNDLGLQVQLVLETVTEQVDGNEAVVVGVELFEVLTNLADDIQLIELVSVAEERWRNAEQRRVEHMVHALKLQAALNEPDQLLLQVVIIADDLLTQRHKLIAINVSLAVSVKLRHNVSLNSRSIQVEYVTQVVDSEQLVGLVLLEQK